jgi:hypothetical protein
MRGITHKSTADKFPCPLLWAWSASSAHVIEKHACAPPRHESGESPCTDSHLSERPQQKSVSCFRATFSRKMDNPCGSILTKFSFTTSRPSEDFPMADDANVPDAVSIASSEDESV